MVSSTAEPADRDACGITERSRSDYVRRVIEGEGAVPWWTTVVITASSARQAERYAEEIRRRREGGRIPGGVHYLTVPDPGGLRIGSGGATLNALRTIAGALVEELSPEALSEWWAAQRVLIMHSGGDSRRLPQYSLSGKLFSTLPVDTPWSDVSTVFDEMLALSTAWAAHMPSGLLVGSGDVVLTFDAGQLHWDRPGVAGVAMRRPVGEGTKHGVYVTDAEGRVYHFLQKPTREQVRMAGGLLHGDTVALDTGLLRFDAPTAAMLSRVAAEFAPAHAADAAAGLPLVDLYEHFTGALTGQWQPGPQAVPVLQRLAAALADVPFWCDLVDGDFMHIGTTALFRQLMAGEGDLLRRYGAQQRLPATPPPGVRSAGRIIDSVLAPGSELGDGALTIECEVASPIRVGAGAILHGVTGHVPLTEVPDDTVVHQVPVARPGATPGIVIRVYGVADDPKATLASGAATWFERPILEVLEALGICPDAVWEDDVPSHERSLWNAHLFPVDAPDRAWRYASWMLQQSDQQCAAEWAGAERLSLAASALRADTSALADARSRRRRNLWQSATLALAEAGSDIRPMIAGAPSPASLAKVGRSLCERTAASAKMSPAKAASALYQASRFLAHAGLAEDAEQARAAAFAHVQKAICEEALARVWLPSQPQWQCDSVRVSAPARIDLGGGWSDTPPFCVDWGGTVLNVAVTIDGGYPIVTSMRRLEALEIRCVSADAGRTECYRTSEEILAPLEPGCPFSIPRACLQVSGLITGAEPLQVTLARLGGGLEVRTEVDLPMGSGLGTSSILGATAMRALAQMLGVELGNHDLSDQVMGLEQWMTTGGGWQDQAGGIFPGAKLIRTGPGARQRLRVEPVTWDTVSPDDFSGRLVLYYSGLQRIAKGLLAQVVGSYLARETATVQVLHSIKTLAEEMRYALQEGAWSYLGEMVDRHWQLNQQMTPHMANAPVNTILRAARPFIVGAKPVGAGGGGFILLLTEDPDAAAALKAHLGQAGLPGHVADYGIAASGLQIRTDAFP